MITAILPAYNEFDELPRAIEALRAQTVPPDHIVVALNNSAPGLAEVAAATGVDVIDLGDCPGMKAEALNRVFQLLMLTATGWDMFVVADADSRLAPTWIETALEHVDESTVVGGIFLGEQGGGWLGACAAGVG